MSDKRFHVERCWDQLNPGPPYMRGGPFRKVRGDNPWFDVQGKTLWFKTIGSLTWYYDGGWVPLDFGLGDEMTSSQIGNVGVSGPYDGTYADGYQYGASAYNRYKPRTDGYSQLAVFLGEIGEVPGQMMTSAKGFHDVYKTLGGKTDARGLIKPGRVADHFLNHQFGWVPFLNDINSFADTYDHADERIAQLRRDNGQWVKRAGRFKHTNDWTNIQDFRADNAPHVWPPPDGHLLRFPDPARPNKWGNTIVHTATEETVWFEGRFRYYVPEWDPKVIAHQSSSVKRLYWLKDRIRLFGGRLSPSTVWNLCPWSWLVDWGTNVGDVVDNITTYSSDNLVSKYAYIMRHRTRKVFNDSVIYGWKGTEPSTVRCLWSQEIETKDRQPAYPYGFSTTWDGFSTRQIAILAALGITRQIF